MLLKGLKVALSAALAVSLYTSTGAGAELNAPVPGFGNVAISIFEHFLDHWAWPFAIVTIVAIFACNEKLSRLFGTAPKLIKKISAGGVEIELNPEAIADLRAHLTSSLTELTEKAEIEYERVRNYFRIYDRLADVIDEGVKHVLRRPETGRLPKDFRATIHVPDIVFLGYLYQFVDYYPIPTKSAGRRFSFRYGIIGRSWRLEKSLGEGNAFARGKNVEKTLIEEWGMLRRETVQPSIRNRPAYITVILRSPENDLPIDLLYIDSTEEDAFGSDDEAQRLANDLYTDPEMKALAKALDQAVAPLRLVASAIEIGR
jgi:hypothetical protein